MNQLELKELHKIWLKFLNTTNTDEGELWLDVFLAKYLQSLSNETPGAESAFSFRWKCSGNILAHQLLTDVYQTCETVKSLASVESEDVESQVSALFKSYILDGRGWKLLWTLENIGVQTLLCLIELVKLLIVHFPVIMTLPVGESNIPASLRRNPLDLSLDFCFDIPKRSKQALFTRVYGKCDFLTLKRKKFYYRKKMRKKSFRATDNVLLSSSEESCMVLEPCIIPATQLRTVQKSAHKAVLERNALSDKDESGYDIFQSELNCIDYSIKDFENYSISVTEYVHFIIRLFQDCVLLDKKGLQCSSFTSPSILEFSLVTLQKVHQKFEGWPIDAVNELKNHLLKLVFLSTTVTSSLLGYTGAPNENETLTSLLFMASDKLFSAVATHRALPNEDLSFIYDLTVGALMMIQNTILICDGEYAKVICIIRTFSTADGLNICCNIVSYLEKINSSTSEKQITKLLSLIRGIILHLKSVRAFDVGKKHHYDHKHSFHISELAHHESDIFGPPVSHSVINTEPICCVATMSNLMLKIFSCSVSSCTLRDILKQFRACGICCCIDSSAVLKTFFNRFSSYVCGIQHEILMLLEKYLFSQLGLTSHHQSQCNHCKKRMEETDLQHFLSFNTPFERSATSATQLNTLQKLKENSPFWNMLAIYNELLNLESPESVKLVSKHLIQLFEFSIETVKIQMFFRVILPQFLLCNSKCNQLKQADYIRIDCFLSVLPYVLDDFSVTSAFVCCGGMPILYQFALLTEFRLLTLNVLKLLITSEYLSLKNKPDLIISPSVEQSHLRALSLFCDFLLDHTEALVTKLKTCVNSFKVNSECVPSDFEPSHISFLCDVWTTFNELSQKLEIVSLYKLGSCAISSGNVLLLFMLENFSNLLTITNGRQLKNVQDKNILSLMQSLLEVFLKAPEEVFPKDHFFTSMKQSLICHAASNADDLILLTDLFLKCSLTSSISKDERKICEKTSIENTGIIDELSSSGDEAKTFSSNTDSYAADSEQSHSCSHNIKTGNAPFSVKAIEHGEMVRLVVEYVINIQLHQSSDLTAAVTFVIQELVGLCKENEFNSVLLCSQGIPSLLLEGFSKSLKLDNDILKDFQICALKLFAILARYSAEAQDLKQIIDSFKVPCPPMDHILLCLNDTIEGTVNQPVHSLSFPVMQLNQVPLPSKTRKRLTAAFSTLSSQILGKPSPSSLSSWATAAVLCPLTEDSHWNSFKKGFSYMLWIKLNEQRFKSSSSGLEGGWNEESKYYTSSDVEMEQPLLESQVLHVASIGSNKFMFETWCDVCSGDIIIRISTYNNGAVMNVSEATLKSWLKHGSWQHVSLNFSQTTQKSISNCKIQMILNGVKETTVNLKYRSSEYKNMSDLDLLLGHSSLHINEKPETRSYNLGSFMLFKDEELTRDVIFYLASLGPDVTCITDCALKKSSTFLPKNVSYNEVTKSPISLPVITGLKAPSLRQVQHLLLCLYVAERPNDYLVYPHSNKGSFRLALSNIGGNSRFLPSDDWLYQAQPVVQSVLQLGILKKEEWHDFQYAVQHAGGISIFLFLFAHVLEISAAEKTQTAALQLLLKLINKNNTFYEDFIKIKGDDLLFQLISTNCTISTAFLKVFLSNCLNCHSSEKTSTSEEIKIRHEGNAVITNPQLFILMLKSVIFSENTTDDAMALFFSVMNHLLSHGNPNFSVNVLQITTVETLDTILWLLKKKYLSAEGQPFTSETAKMISPLIEKMLYCKFDVLVLQSIIHFLVLLHKTSATLVCHSRSAFFFLFPQNRYVPKAQKRSSASFLKRLPFLQDSDSELGHLMEVPPLLQRSPSYHGQNFEKLLTGRSDTFLTRRINSETCISSLTDRERSSSSKEKSPIGLEQENVIVKNDKSARFRSDLRNDSFSSDNHAVVEICTGLLNLIQNTFSKVSDKMLESIMTFMQPEIFIVLAYNSNPQVQASAIKVIHTYLQYATTEKLNEFFAMKGFHLLAKQLHQLPPDLEVIEVCFKLTSGQSTLFDFSFHRIEGTLSNVQIQSWFVIFSILPAAFNNVLVCKNILSFLNLVLQQTDFTVLMELVNNGLFEFLAKFVLNIAHHQRENNQDLFEKNDLLLIIGNSICYMTRELFSSKQPSHFDQLQTMLNLFTALERRCSRDCSCESQCVTAIRACQCIIYLTALVFAKHYCFNQMDLKSETIEAKKHAWHILPDISETFPGITSISSMDVVDSTSHSESDPCSSISHTSSSDSDAQMRHGIEKAKRELPMTDVAARLQIIISKATDFIVFRDLATKAPIKEEEFFKVLFSFCVKGLTAALDKNRGSSSSKYMSFMWCLKDCLKIQISRLLLASLALPQNLYQREYTLKIVANHKMCKVILHLVIVSMSKASNLLLFLHDLQTDSNIPSAMRKNLLVVYNHVKDLLNDQSSLNIVKDKALFEMNKKKWPQLWNQDRWKWLAMTNSIIESAFQSKEKLAQKISEYAMDVTKNVSDIQNIEWKKFTEELKISYYDEASLRLSWSKLSEHMTHERAVWHMSEYYPNSWELDPTEGPFRIRRRLRRCYLNVEPRFLMPQFEEKLLSKKRKVPFVGLLENRCGFSDSAAVIHKLHSNEQIEYNCPCQIITAFEEAKAEILIGDCCLHIIAERCQSSLWENTPSSETCPFNCIKEILQRRFELQNFALEIFMSNGLTYLIAFQSGKDLENIWRRLEDHGLPCRMSTDLSVTQLWRDGTITNFEYITHLNKLSGRSFNDLMQYPVFPFILADYASPYIDIQDSTMYRNLSRPAAIQHKYREQYFINTYNWLKEQTSGPQIDTVLPFASPYHYGSHYSNSGTVLSFLIRLLPFTYGFIAYQDNNFDIPDRSFHSMQTAWELVTKHSTSDVKELIPEFFFLPEFLCNKEGFDFGVRQTGVRVNDVLLPPWSKQNSRLFVLIHRQALESDFVTNNLHGWIDLVFGFKQTGEPAINAINVFHPATYFGWNTDNWKDPITRRAVKAMIKTIGQMPKQLFFNPHSMVSLSLTSVEQMDKTKSPMKVIDTVDGLKWGNYVGSPSTGVPSLVWRRKQSIVLGSFLTMLTNDVFGLGQNICLLLNHKKDDGVSITSSTFILSVALVSWGYKDGIVRIKLCRDQPAIPLLKGSILDPVCLCASVPDCKHLFVAHMSGKILIFDLDIDSASNSVSENNSPLQLNGHCDVINSIFISKAFSIFVTASKDKIIIIWDLNRLNYVRSILDHETSVKLVCVSETLGDIASVSSSADGSCLKIHTINGDLVGSVNLSETVTALCYSTAPEGVSVNVVATGLHTGTIRLWSSWDLKPVREIKSDKFLLPIRCLTFSVDNQHLYAANKEGTVAVWEKPSKGLTTVPRLLLFT